DRIQRAAIVPVACSATFTRIAPFLLRRWQAIERTVVQRRIQFLGDTRRQNDLQPACAQDTSAELGFLVKAPQQRPCGARLEPPNAVTVQFEAGWQRVIEEQSAGRRETCYDVMLRRHVFEEKAGRAE